MLRILVPALALVLLAFPASAWECVEGTSNPEIDTGPTAAGRYYVDNDPCLQCWVPLFWIYEESNGRDGLQRNDWWQDDTCGRFPSDTIVF